MSSEFSVEYRCPVNGERLVRAGDELVGEKEGLRYPIVDGVPLLIADTAERTQ